MLRYAWVAALVLVAVILSALLLLTPEEPESCGLGESGTRSGEQGEEDATLVGAPIRAPGIQGPAQGETIARDGVEAMGPCVVMGVVRDADGAVVPHARIIARGRKTPAQMWIDAVDAGETTADGQGRWVLHVPRTLQEVSLTAATSNERSPQKVIEPGPDESFGPVVLIVRRGVTVPVVVVSANGEETPLAGIRVGISVGPGMQMAVDEVNTTNAEGRCVFTNVLLPASVFALGPGGGSTGVRLDARHDLSEDVRIPVPRDLTKTMLRLTSAQTTMTGASVVCVLDYWKNSWGYYQRRTALVNGDPIPVTSYRGGGEAVLRLRLPGCGSIELDWRELVESDPARVVIPLDDIGLVTLRFVLAGTETHLERFSPALECKCSALGTRAVARVTTDRDGAARTWLPKGDYAVTMGKSTIGEFRITGNEAGVLTVGITGHGVLAGRVTVDRESSLAALELVVSSLEQPVDVSMPPELRKLRDMRPKGLEDLGIERPMAFTRKSALRQGKWRRVVPWPVGTPVHVAVIEKETGREIAGTDAQVGDTGLVLDAVNQAHPMTNVAVSVRKDGELLRSGMVWLRNVKDYPQDTGGDAQTEAQRPFTSEAPVDRKTGVARLVVRSHGSYSVVWLPEPATGLRVVIGAPGGKLPADAIRASTVLHVGGDDLEARVDLE